MPQHDIFISYSRRDEQKVFAICNRLEKSGFTLWIDKDGIESGDAFKKNIVEAIESSKVFLFFSSANSNASYWTAKEVALAIDDKKPVIPIRLDDSQYNKEIRFDLINIDFIDARKGNLDEATYAHLVRSLAKKCSKTITSQPATPKPATPKSRPVQPASTPTYKPAPKKASIFDKIIDLIDDWGGWVLFWIVCGAVGYWGGLAIVNLFHKDTPAEIYAKAIKYYNDKDYETALPLMQKAADAGDAKAQYNLASDYYHGTGTQIDYEQAAEWYRKSAEQNHASAQYMLGHMYQKGKGVQQNYAEAVKWYQKAADQGNANAQNSLGNMYYSGYGVTKNYTEAAKWYRKAAEQDNATAQYDLGYVYENGLGVPKNQSEAIKWYKKAANQGNESAQKALSRLNTRQ